VALMRSGQVAHTALPSAGGSAPAIWWYPTRPNFQLLKAKLVSALLRGLEMVSPGEHGVLGVR
jgi:hypothetical protein